MGRHKRQRRQKPLSEVETVLVDHAVTAQLNRIVRAGCKRERIMSLLELAFLVDESWEALTGMDLRTLKTNLAKISECADMIKRLNGAELIYRTAFELKDTYFAQIYQSPTLPELLLEYANKIKSLLRIQGPGHKIYLHVWKAHFVAIVVESTGKAHDLEVSSIIAAVLNTPKYSEKAHQAWRLRYAQVIENERVRLRARL